ncbi:MAG TPA: hypothetical protein VIX89_01990 [Bryobacteraceae bacterium]
MSSVRKALKISDVWQPKPASAFEGRVLPLGPTPPPEPIKPTVEEITPIPAALPKAPLSLMARLVRRIKRLLRIRSGAVVPRCNGLTRRGLACRAPAMLNGYCRMHGGSRKLLG